MTKNNSLFKKRHRNSNSAKSNSVSSSSSYEDSNSINSISELRKHIDLIDRKMLKLLNSRAKIVKQVGELKKKQNLHIYDPRREQEILNKIVEEPHSQLLNSEVKTFFQNLISFFRTTEASHTLRLSSSLLPTHSKVGFLGFGLIGASIGLALKNQFQDWSFQIVDPYINKKNFTSWCIKNNAPQFKLITKETLSQCDFVFLCAPISINELSAKKITKTNKLVLNTGSVLTNFPSVYGFHPLAGKEQAKYQSAQDDLFFGKTICITNTDELDPKELFLIKGIASALGAKTWIGSADHHNEMLAYSSHLIQLLSMAFGQCLPNEKWKNNLHLLPSNAKNLLRLTGSNLEMWESILVKNKKNILKAIKDLNLELKNIELKLNSKKGIKNLFIKSSKDYKNLYQKGSQP